MLKRHVLKSWTLKISTFLKYVSVWDIHCTRILYVDCRYLNIYFYLLAQQLRLSTRICEYSFNS